ncbi:lytic transglycosylase [Deinococcus multiflagellatus]|uniref:LysM peptidoglycan-binding domain-containing protein n=1 Tax=Deinococcus multiflagellatus TaxID=1656887 RepID=A0ABW1ZQP5_9DEIO
MGALVLGQGKAQTAAPADLRVASSVTVQAGDTAYSLARRAGLTLDALLALNGLSTPDLKVGQVLKLRAQGPAAVQAQGLPAAPALTHTVQAGDTLFALARRYGVSVDALLAANGLSSGAVVRTGQVLVLPAGAQASAVASAAPAAPVSVPAPAPRPGVQGSPFVPGARRPVRPRCSPAPPCRSPGGPPARPRPSLWRKPPAPWAPARTGGRLPWHC